MFTNKIEELFLYLACEGSEAIDVIGLFEDFQLPIYAIESLVLDVELIDVLDKYFNGIRLERPLGKHKQGSKGVFIRIHGLTAERRIRDIFFSYAEEENIFDDIYIMNLNEDTRFGYDQLLKKLDSSVYQKEFKKIGHQYFEGNEFADPDRLKLKK